MIIINVVEVVVDQKKFLIVIKIEEDQDLGKIDKYIKFILI